MSISVNDYCFPTTSRDPSLLFFSKNPCKDWSFQNFKTAMNSDSSRPCTDKSLFSNFTNALKNIKNNKKTPEEIRQRVELLLEQETDEPITSTNGTVNHQTLNNYGSISNSNIQLGIQSEKTDQATSDFGFSSQSSLSSENNSSQDDNIPSDLTLDYHPQRVSEYFFEDTQQHQQEVIKNDEKQSVWSLEDGFCVSEQCKQVKENTIKMNLDPASLSDIRILALNDMYLFQQDRNVSITRYFGINVHRRVIVAINKKFYHADPQTKAMEWCTKVTTNPPADFIQSLSVCAKFILKATTSGNIIDIHTAQTLNDLLPSFLSGSPDATIEDTFVHMYLSPILHAVFRSDPHFEIQWANGRLSEDTKNYKPDFKVFTRVINKKCTTLVTEIKPPTQHSLVESDLVKLCRQMKRTYNNLVLSGVPRPAVCGLLVDGFYMEMFVMDMPSPRLYRVAKLGGYDIFRGLEQFMLIPGLISLLLQVKSIILETIIKAESAVICAHQNLQKVECVPPSSWLSSDNYILARKRRRDD